MPGVGFNKARRNSVSHKQRRKAVTLNASDYIATGALSVSLFSVIFALRKSRSEPVEVVIEGLRGDRRAVTYAAQSIRLTGYLKRSKYRSSLIASLLLAWSFETSDRARAAVLAALVQAHNDYRGDYYRVVEDLVERFEVYERVVEGGDIERGRQRLDAVTKAVETASAKSAGPTVRDQ
jgi:hypothetical protein